MDIRAEIDFHLTEEADERRAEGLSESQARLAARRDFGNQTLVREDMREAWSWMFAERAVQDLRLAARMVRRDRGVSALAVLTLALGIGATTAVFNVVNALMLRPLPFPAADRLVVLFATTPRQNVFRDTTSFWDIAAWRERSHAFTGVASYRRDPFNVTGDGPPEPVVGLSASHEILNVLGVQPIVGRGFHEAEQHAAQPVALISHGLWMRRFGGDPRILTRSIALNEVSHAVVGVLPRGFQFVPFQDVDVIVPVAERPCRGCGYIRAVARLDSGASIATAQHELDAIAASLEKEFPESNAGRGVSAVPLREVAVGSVRTQLLVLLGAGAFVLLIGCGNVGNLVLTRGLARQRELAVRSALGAGASRLVRQLLTESVGLALAASVIGALFAFLGSELLVASLAHKLPLPPISFDWVPLAAAVGLAVISGVLTGLPPAFMVWKADLNSALKQDARSQSGTVQQRRLRDLLVVCQTALTIMLLISAGLLAKSFLRLQQVEIGFEPRNLMTVELYLSSRYADSTLRATFLKDVFAAVEALPGVERVAAHTDSPFDGGGRQDAYTFEGIANPGPKRGHGALTNLVAGDFFGVMRIPIVRGRGFDSRDTLNSEPVALINETMARRFWPNQDPTGRRLRFFYDKDPNRWVSIVGIARDARYRYEEAEPQVFLPHEQNPFRSSSSRIRFMSLAVRTAGDPSGMANALQRAVWSIDKDQPVLHAQPVDEVLWQSVAEPRVYARLIAIFAAIALAIACGGIYGVSAYAVVRRTREIGIRVAMGASSAQILALILRGAMVFVVAGIAIGVSGSLALTTVISRFLFGITPTDAPTFLTVVVLFGAVACLATYIPARRAARSDPMVVFRSE